MLKERGKIFSWYRKFNCLYFAVNFVKNAAKLLLFSYIRKRYHVLYNIKVRKSTCIIADIQLFSIIATQKKVRKWYNKFAYIKSFLYLCSRF